MKNETTKYSGIGFTGLLTIMFITLKLVGTISWSWWWVLSPIWIEISLVVLASAIIILFENEKKR